MKISYNMAYSSIIIASYIFVIFNPTGWHIVGHIAPLYLVFCLISITKRKAKCNSYKKVYISLFLFLIYVGLSWIFISQYEHAIKLYLYYCIAILTFIVFTSYRFTCREVNYIVNGYILSAIVIVIKLIFQHHSLIKDPSRLTIIIANKEMDPNFLAASLIAPTIFCIYYNKNKKYVPLFRLLSLVIFLGILFTGSRGAFVSIVLAVAINYFFNKTAQKRVRLFLLLALGLGSFVSLLPDNIVSRFNIKNFYDASNSLRINLWLASIKIFLSNPIWGRGGNSMLALGMDYGARSNLQSHNTFLEILTDYGIIGFLLLGYCFGTILKVSFKKKNFLVFSICVSTFCCAFFLPASYSAFLWQNLMLSYALQDNYDNKEGLSFYG